MAEVLQVPKGHGLDPPRPKLYLPAGTTGVGFLCLYYPGPDSEWLPLLVELKPAVNVLVLALWRAMCEDAGLPAQVRGWRSPSALAKTVAQYTRWELEPQAVRAYMSKIHRLIRESVGQVTDLAPERLVPQFLLERRRNLGARLAVDNLEVVDLSQSPDPDQGGG